MGEGGAWNSHQRLLALCTGSCFHFQSSTQFPLKTAQSAASNFPLCALFKHQAIIPYLKFVASWRRFVCMKGLSGQVPASLLWPVTCLPPRDSVVTPWYSSELMSAPPPRPPHGAATTEWGLRVRDFLPIPSKCQLSILVSGTKFLI
jgi:hypothetical protein